MIETYKSLLVHADTASKQYTKTRDAEFVEALNEAHKICKWALNRKILREVEKDFLPQACSKFSVYANKNGDTQLMNWDLDPTMPSKRIGYDKVIIFIDGQPEWECELIY